VSKLVYIARKEAGKAFRVINSKILKEELSNLPNGKYRLTIEKYRKNKSLPQLGYYYACVLPIFHRAALDAGWEFASIDELDIYLKSQFANRELINKNTGEVIEIPALKRDMTTTEFSTYVNQVRDHCAEFLGVHIPDPETSLELPI
jgi:hypothetical protein